MDTQKLSLLITVLVVLGGLAYLTRQDTAIKTSGLQAGQHVVQPFDANAVNRLELHGPDHRTTLTRTEGKWVVESLYGYPADFSKLAEQIRGLSNLKAGQVIRNGAQYLDEFGLGESGTTLLLKDSRGQELVTLVLGNERADSASPYGEGGERYVLTGNQEVALVDGEINRLPQDARGWISTALLNVPAADLSAITVSSNQTSYTMTIGSNTTYRLDGLAETQEVDRANAGRLSRALQYLNFSSVLDPATPDAELGLDNPVTYAATATNGVTYALRIGKALDNGIPVRLAISHEGDQAPENLAALQLHEQWTYLISSYSAEGLTLGREKLVKETEAPKAESE